LSFTTTVIALATRCGRILPPGCAWRVGGALGECFGRLPLRDQRRAGEHLRRAWPDAEPAWIERTARRCFRHFGRMALWTLATVHRHPAHLRRACTWEGRAHLAAARRACAAGRGTLICSGHLGNWELLARVTGTVMPATVLGKRMRHPAVDRFVAELRAAGDNRTMYQDAGLRACVRELRSGRLMATLPDQDVPRLAGCFVPWFGEAAYTPIGPVLIAALARAPVQCVYCLWRGGRWVMHWGPRWELDRELPREQAAAALTARVTAYQEALVRRHPEQWAWWHKRWRTRPHQRPDAPCWPPTASGAQAPPASLSP